MNFIWKLSRNKSTIEKYWKTIHSEDLWVHIYWKTSILRTCECTYTGKQTILRTCECTYIGKQTILRTCESIYWTSMPIMSHYNSYYWTSMPILSQSEKLLYVLSHPAGLLSRKNYDFWKFWTCPFWKVVHFLKFWHFVKNGSPGETTMPIGLVSKFCVEPQSPFSYVSHHDPKTLGKPPNIVSWLDCRPELWRLQH